MESQTPDSSVALRGSECAWLGLLLVGSAGLGLHGLLNYGYIGQDFPLHRHLIESYPDGYSFRETNPPVLYWLGALIRHHVTTTHYLEALGLILLALNTLALAGFYRVIRAAIGHPTLRLAAATLVTFVPVRVIHAMVISSDAFTLPVFAATACCTLDLRRNPRRISRWLGLTVVLTLGMAMKYSLVGLLPPVAFALGTTLWRNGRGTRGSTAAWLAIALALPTMVFLGEMRESAKVGGATTSGHWKAPGTPSIMRWQDILLPKPNDWRLLYAPEYFKDGLYLDRAYSYAGLLIVTTFTDSQNFLQQVPPGVSTAWDQRVQEDPGRQRAGLSRRLQRWSVRWNLPLALLTLAGTMATLVWAIPALVGGAGRVREGAALLAILSGGVYAPIFFSFTSLGDPYTPGYWHPRLVLAALVGFLVLGYVLLDVAHARLAHRPRVQALLPRLALGHAFVSAAIFVGFLG
jgi:4-amino-4-deoxy-L-arabinose transferase-like glycosyltransferase